MACGEDELRQLTRDKARPPAARPLGQTLEHLMRDVIYPRQKTLAELAQAWQDLLPPVLVSQTGLEDFSGGTLRVTVRSSPCHAELDMLLRGGLVEQLRARCPGIPLRQVRLLRRG